MTGWWKKIHSVGLKQSRQRPDLFLGVSLLDHLLCRYQILGRLAQLAEELLHLASGLVHVDDLARVLTHAAPHVRNVARHKHTFTCTELESFVVHVKLKLALNDIDPLILIVMQ